MQNAAKMHCAALITLQLHLSRIKSWRLAKVLGLIIWQELVEPFSSIWQVCFVCCLLLLVCVEWSSWSSLLVWLLQMWIIRLAGLSECWRQTCLASTIGQYWLGRPSCNKTCVCASLFQIYLCPQKCNFTNYEHFPSFCLFSCLIISITSKTWLPNHCLALCLPMM